MKIKKEAYLLLMVNIIWAIAVFFLCAMPSGELPKIRIPYIDKIAHFGFFFIQSLLFCFMLSFQGKRRYWPIVCLATLLAVFYGGLIEILQNRFFNRTGDVYDLAADILGGFTGAIIYPAILGFFSKNRVRKSK